MSRSFFARSGFGSLVAALIVMLGGGSLPLVVDTNHDRELSVSSAYRSAEPPRVCDKETGEYLALDETPPAAPGRYFQEGTDHAFRWCVGSRTATSRECNPSGDLDQLDMMSSRQERLKCVGLMRSYLYEKERDRRYLAEAQMMSRLSFLVDEKVPVEAALKQLVRLACRMPASRVAFWDVAATRYHYLVRERKQEFVGPWPRSLTKLYNQRCIHP